MSNLPSSMNIGVDASDALKAIEALEKRFASMNKTVADFSKVSITFNQDGKKMEAVIRGLTDNGEKFVSKLAKSGTGLRVVSTEFEKTGKSIEQLNKDFERGIIASSNYAKNLKKIKEQSELDLRARLIRQTISSPIPQGANLNNVLNYEDSLDRVTDFVRKGQINLNRLNEVYTQVKKGQINNLNQVERQAASAFIALEKSRGEMERVGEAEVEMSKKGTAANERLILSWVNFIRYIEAHLIYTFLFRLISGFQEGAQAAAEYSIRISELRTISQESTTSFNTWSKSIRQLSDEFNLPLLDVASATYETLSNQIAKGTEAINFQRDALIFARTTVASATDSVNLLSSAINSYGFHTNQTNLIAASFFNTINLGRVKASEMADTFGRVSALSSQLGVNLNEVNAAIAFLTIKGIKYNEAFTLITNFETKLIKPTTQMTELLKEMGYATSEAAIAGMGGFVPFLNVLAKKINGNSQLAAEFGSNIRSIRALLSFTSDLKGYQDTLSKISDPSQYIQATKITTESVGYKLTKELNKIKNDFIVFGDDLDTTIVKVTSSFGGLENTIITLGRLLITGATVWGVYKLALKPIFSNLENIRLSFIKFGGTLDVNAQNIRMWGSSLGSSFVKLAGAVGPTAILTGITIGLTYLENKLAEIEATYDTVLNQLKTKQRDYELYVQAAEQKTLNLEIEAINEYFKKRLNLSAELLKIQDKEVEAQRKATQDIAKSASDIFDAAMRGVRQTTNDLAAAASKATSNIQRAQEAMEKAKQEFADTQYQNQLNSTTDPTEQLEIRVKKVTEYLKLMSEATQNKNVPEAGRLYGLINNELNTMSASAKQAKSRLAEIDSQLSKSYDAQKLARAREEIHRIQAEINNTKNPTRAKELAAQLKSLQDSIKNSDIDAKIQALSDEQAKLKKLVDSIPDTQKLIQDTYRTYLQGLKDIQDQESKTAAQKAEQARIAAEQANKQQTYLTEIAKFQVTDASGNAIHKNPLEDFDKIVGSLIDAGFNDPKSFLQITLLRKQIENEAKAVDARTKLIQTQTDLKNKSEELNKSISDLTNKIASTRADAGDQTDKLVAFAAALKAISRTIVRPDGSYGLGVDNKASTTSEEKTIDVKPFIELVTKLQQQKTLSDEDQRKLVDMMQTMQDNFAGGISGWGTSGVFKQLFETDPLTGKVSAGQIQESLKKLIADLQQKAKNQKQLDLENEYLRQIGIQIGENRTLTANTASLNSQFVQLITSIKNLNSYLNQQNPGHGFASGGLARGTDTVAAMLSPGEFVMNSRATAKFLPQLVSMNSGAKGYAQGGMVSVGDINVHGVPISGDVRVDARQLGKQLRREIRRGTLNWKVH